MRILERVRQLCTDPRAATAVEYGLILSLIVMSMIFALQGLATVTTDMWNDVSSKTSEAISQ